MKVHCGVTPDAGSSHLFVRVHHDVALDALLPHVGPAVATHPLAFALGTLILAKTSLLALVRRQPLSLGASLHSDKGTGLHTNT